MSSPAQRLGTIKHQLTAVTANATRASYKNDDDVVIISARRTAICKARRGGFKVTLLRKQAFLFYFYFICELIDIMIEVATISWLSP